MKPKMDNVNDTNYSRMKLVHLYLKKLWTNYLNRQNPFLKQVHKTFPKYDQELAFNC